MAWGAGRWQRIQQGKTQFRFRCRTSWAEPTCNASIYYNDFLNIILLKKAFMIAISWFDQSCWTKICNFRFAICNKLLPGYNQLLIYAGYVVEPWWMFGSMCCSMSGPQSECFLHFLFSQIGSNGRVWIVGGSQVPFLANLRWSNWRFSDSYYPIKN